MNAYDYGANAAERMLDAEADQWEADARLADEHLAAEALAAAPASSGLDSALSCVECGTSGRCVECGGSPR